MNIENAENKLRATLKDMDISTMDALIYFLSGFSLLNNFLQENGYKIRNVIDNPPENINPVDCENVLKMCFFILKDMDFVRVSDD